MHTTMMAVPLSVLPFIERAATLFARHVMVSRLPDKSLRTHRYGEWAGRTRALASALQRAGIRRGDRIATLCWNHHAHLEAYFGIPAAGAVMHTLNLRLSAADLAGMAEDVQDRFLIVDDVLLPLARQILARRPFERVIVFPFSGAPVAAEFTDYEAFLASGDGAGFTPAAHDEDDAIAVCHTAGTTGRPRAVVYSHRSTVLHSLVAALPDATGLQHSDVVLPVTPMFHVNGWGMPYAAVMLGAKLVFPGPHLHAEDLLDLMQQEPPTLALGVPTIWHSLIHTYERAAATTPGRWRLPEGMRSMVGGAALPESLIRAYARHGIRLQQGWGMTETSPLATVAFPRGELREAGEDAQFRQAASAGTPVPLIALRLATEDGQTAPWDGRTMGELQVRGPFVTAGYHGQGAEGSACATDAEGRQWLRTGDVAVIDPMGVLRLTDRIKDLIRSGGEWISSVALEEQLMTHPAVAEAAVIAVRSEAWGERPLACIVCRPGLSVDPAELNLLLLDHGFVKWQLPDRYEFLAAMPRTAQGRVWKLKLRTLFPV